MFFSFFFSPFMQRSSNTAHLSLPATQLLLQSDRKRERNIKGNKGNKGDRDEERQSGQYSTLAVLKQLSVLILCFFYYSLIFFWLLYLFL